MAGAVLYNPAQIPDCPYPLEGFEEAYLHGNHDCQGREHPQDAATQLQGLAGADAWACGRVVDGVETVLWSTYWFRHPDGTYNLNPRHPEYVDSVERTIDRERRDAVIDDVQGQLLDHLKKAGDNVWVVMFGSRSWRVQFTLNAEGGHDRITTKHTPWALISTIHARELACAKFHAAECELDSDNPDEAERILEGIRSELLPEWAGFRMELQARLLGRLHDLEQLLQVVRDSS